MTTNKCRFKIGDVVVLKTKIFENSNPKISREIFRTTGTETSIETSFISPHMVVINTIKPSDNKMTNDKFHVSVRR